MSVLSVVQHPVLTTSRNSSANAPLHRTTHVPLQTRGFLYGSAKACRRSRSTQSLEASYVASPPTRYRSSSACKPVVPSISGASQPSLRSFSSVGRLERHLPCSAPPESSPRHISTRQVVATPAPFKLPQSETPSTPRSPRQRTFFHHAAVESLPVHRSRSCIFTRLPDGRLASRAQAPVRSPRQSSSPLLVQSISSHPVVHAVRSPRLLQSRSPPPPKTSVSILGAGVSQPVGKTGMAGERVIATVDLSLGKIRNITDCSVTGGSCFPSSWNHSSQVSAGMSRPSSETADIGDHSCAMSCASTDFESSPTMVNSESFADMRYRFDSKDSLAPEALSPACSAIMSVPVCFIDLFQSHGEPHDCPKLHAAASSSRLDVALTKSHRTLRLQPELDKSSSSPAQDHDNESIGASQKLMAHSSPALAPGTESEASAYSWPTSKRTSPSASREQIQMAAGAESEAFESEATACSWPTSKRTSPSVSREKIQIADDVLFSADTSIGSQSKHEIDDSPTSHDSPSSRNVIFEFSVSLDEASSLIAASEAARLVLTQGRLSGSAKSSEEKGDAPLSKATTDVGVDSQQPFYASQKQFRDYLSDLDTAADDCTDDGLSPISHCIRERGTCSEPSPAVSGTAMGFPVDEAAESFTDTEGSVKCNDVALAGAIDALVCGPTFQDVTMEAKQILCRVRRDVSKHVPEGTDEADVSRVLWSRIYEEVGKQLQLEVASQNNFQSSQSSV